LMEELASRYSDRVIVFDSPPLLLTNESGVLASFMGQIVFVAAANHTPQHAVQEALERIGKDKMVAVMLNKAPKRRFKLFGISSGYSYGGYGYGYGAGHREEAHNRTTEVTG
jgi:protein-tyrosine kinase